MIKQSGLQEVSALLSESGVEAQKIRALLLAYGTNYDFCRFFTAGKMIVARFYDDFIISDNGVIDFDELCEFLNFSGFSRIFCSENIGKNLADNLALNYNKLNLMRFCGNFGNISEKIFEPDLSDAYEILKTSFEIDFEPWYLDMSHKIRHGISRIYGIDKSVLAVQHNLCGEALLSQIATIPEKRRNGTATELILSVCAMLRDSKIFVLCEDGLMPFYEKIGFEYCGTKYEVFRG